MKKTILTSCLSALLLVSLPLHAEDLMQVYQQALKSDPTFKQAEAEWLATKEELAIAKSGTGVAGSGLFPFVGLSGEINRTYRKMSTGGDATSSYYNGNEYALTVTQPIFNYATWKSISSARYTVKAGMATYLAAAQNLMYRTADAYFNVLRANDTLRYTLAQKRQFLHQLIIAQQKFKVGLIAITGVYDAKASYDSSLAQAISKRNALLDQIENLRAITGQYYTSLKGLKKDIPLLLPEPVAIEQWVKIALNQNYTVKADQNTMLADRELVKEASAGRYPALTGVAGYGSQRAGNVLSSDAHAPDTVTTSGYVALDLNIPVFQGGYVSKTAKQAQYSYLAASDALEYAHRDVVSQTRQSFLGVESGISKIQADEQSIQSARNQLAATKAGYKVGTRTMVDVLDSVTSLYQSQETWSDDRYDYVLNLITLKEEAGTLSPKDLKAINAWLVKKQVFDLKPIEVNKQYNQTKLPKVKGSESTAKPSKAAALRASQYYAVQLYAGHQQAGAEAFVKQQGKTQETLYVVNPKQSGDNWYRVLYGRYATRAQAQQALKKMSAALRENHPWVVLMSKPHHKLAS